MVTQVETPLGFHDVLEQPDHVAVLLEEFQLQIVFVTFDFFAHATIMPGRAPRWVTPPRRALLCGLRRHLPRTAMLLRHAELDDRASVGGRPVALIRRPAVARVLKLLHVAVALDLRED